MRVRKPEPRMRRFMPSSATRKTWMLFVVFVGTLPILTDRIGRGRWPESLAEISVGLMAGAVIVFLGAFLLRRVERDLHELERIALTDELTGAWNARAFHHKLEEASEGWIITADLDRLKEVNDERGHAAGDQLLARATKALKQAVGSMGMVFRTGGDEFALLLLGAGEAETLECARTALSSMASDGDRASFSLGLARFDGDPWSTVARADAAMYAA